MLLITVFIEFIVSVCCVLFADTNALVKKRYKIQTKGKAGRLRLCLLADYHNSGDIKKANKIKRVIKRANPDLVVAAGDIVTTGREYGEYDFGVALLNDLNRRYPVYYAPGNHEAKLLRQPYLSELFKYEISRGGFTWLSNASIKINENVRIYGLNEGLAHYDRFKKKPLDISEMDKLIALPEKSGYNILIAHNPADFDIYKAWGADLVLSGHVHGGIIRLPFLGGLLSPDFSLFPRYDAGKYKLGDANMVVSRGLAGHGMIPFRFLNPGEVVIIDIM